ncbi:MAG: class I tRNA ligase family protein, partial [Methanomassiliicoccales archaeon]
TVLLRYHDDENEKVRESIKNLLSEISKTPAGKEAIIDNVSNPNRDVRRGVKRAILDIWGPQAAPYATLYEQTVMLMGFARKRDVPVDDIERLALITKKTFLEGEMLQAISDISQCLEFVKLRYRNVENLKNYLSDMLRTIPELNKMGVSTNSMETSLKTALNLSRNRQFDYTNDLIEERMRELEIRDELISIGETVKVNILTRPEMQLADLNGMDVWAFEKMSEIIQMTTASNLTGTRSIALKGLHGFLVNEFSTYYENNAKKRVDEMDPSALFTVYIIGIVSLKLVSDLIPVTAEEIYQKYYRGLEQDPTVLMVTWPEVVMRLA